MNIINQYMHLTRLTNVITTQPNSLFRLDECHYSTACSLLDLINIITARLYEYHYSTACSLLDRCNGTFKNTIKWCNKISNYVSILSWIIQAVQHFEEETHTLYFLLFPFYLLL